MCFICAAYCFYNVIYIHKIIVNEKYICVIAKCIDSNHSQLGYGLTSSRVFSFEVVSYPTNVEIQENNFMLQEAVPLKELFVSESSKQPYLVGHEYVMMVLLKDNKNIIKEISNRNVIVSVPNISQDSNDRNRNESED